MICKLPIVNSSQLSFIRLSSSSCLQVGSKVIERRVFTKDDVKKFCQLTGDTNPIHFDDQVARSLNYETVLVPGLLLNGLVSSMIGNHLPGPGSILVKQQLDFLNPCYVNTEVEASVWIVSIKKKFIDCHYECVVKDGDAVLKGNAVIFKPI